MCGNIHPSTGALVVTQQIFGSGVGGVTTLMQCISIDGLTIFYWFCSNKKQKKSNNVPKYNAYTLYYKGLRLMQLQGLKSEANMEVPAFFLLACGGRLRWLEK